MISKINIKNFLSHKDTSLTFGPGINAIIGDPQNGKTGILRCFELLRTNRPLGANYFSKFAGNSGNTECSIATTDGQTISLSKSIKINKSGEKKVESGQYTVNGNTIAASTEVPDIVQNALMMTDLNIQTQLDPPFLITNSAGEVSRVINRITQLEEVDSWVSDLTTLVNEKTRQIDNETANEKKFKSDLDKIQKTLNLENDLIYIEVMDKKRDSLSGEFQVVSDSIEKILVLEDEIVALNKINIDESVAHISRLMRQYEMAKVQKEEIKNIISLSKEIESLSKISIDLKLDLVIKDNQDLQILKGKRSELSIYVQDYEEYQKLSNVYERVNQNINELLEMKEELGIVAVKNNDLNGLYAMIKDVENMQVLFNSTQNELSEAIKTLKQCPTCLHEIDDKTVRRIVESI